MRLLIVTLFFAHALISCASGMQQTTDAPLYKYRANIQITVDNVEFDGMGVTGLTGPKDIALVSQARLDLLKINTCHRDFTIEKVDKGWFGGSGKKYTYHYVPTEKEKSRVCSMYIQSFDKKGITDWGYLAFRTDETLPAVMECNGRSQRYAGISICQTMAGLDQSLTFDRDVEFEADANCSVKVETKRKYTIRGTKGFCLAEFSDGKEWHRMILLGYEKNLIRGD